MATVTFKAYTQALTTLLTTDLNSFANNAISNFNGTVLDNTTALDLFADFELNATFAVAPTVGTGIDLYLVPTIDGTNYEDGALAAANVQPSMAYFAGSFIVRAVTTAQKIAVTGARLGPTKYKAVLVNNATGQAFAASGNTLGFRSYSLTVA